MEYYETILKLKAKIYIPPIPFPILASWFLPWRTDYSIRRVEFDDWLLCRSQAKVKTHHVKKIEKQQGYYVIDEQYRCKYLVGAGGTSCPVRRHFFPHHRIRETKIVTLEKEFEYPNRNPDCHLFFLERGLKGYSWYVPKGKGFVNIGLAGSAAYFSKFGTSINEHFRWFMKDLARRKLLDHETSETLKPSGYGYYLLTKKGEVKQDKCFLIGDAAGLATLDLGEGINPAIESGLLAANEILGNGRYTREEISPMSLNPSWKWLQEIWNVST